MKLRIGNIDIGSIIIIQQIMVIGIVYMRKITVNPRHELVKFRVIENISSWSKKIPLDWNLHLTNGIRNK